MLSPAASTAGWLSPSPISHKRDRQEHRPDAEPAATVPQRQRDGRGDGDRPSDDQHASAAEALREADRGGVAEHVGCHRQQDHQPVGAGRLAQRLGEDVRRAGDEGEPGGAGAGAAQREAEKRRRARQRDVRTRHADEVEPRRAGVGLAEPRHGQRRARSRRGSRAARKSPANRPTRRGRRRPPARSRGPGSLPSSRWRGRAPPPRARRRRG